MMMLRRRRRKDCVRVQAHAWNARDRVVRRHRKGRKAAAAAARVR
jgi:hypothetical protein